MIELVQPALPTIAHFADETVAAGVRDLASGRAMWVTIAGGKHHGAIGLAGATTVVHSIGFAVRLRMPIVIELDSGGADVHEGVSALHGWGCIAKALCDASGVVPTICAVVGACVSGPSLLLGLVDAVIMTPQAFAYVSGPGEVEQVTGVTVSRHSLGGSAVHDVATGVAALVVQDVAAVNLAVTQLLSYLPAHSLVDPPRVYLNDEPRRPCEISAACVPFAKTAAYDVREVIEDVCDAATFCEVRAGYAPNVVTGFARIDGRSVGIVANQPAWRAGTLDIEASRKAARFVVWCDAFNLPIITLVDTPGFEPGRDLEWRGMIRHGAELVHAYCEATVPRIAVVLRKAFGGAYIVMDSRGIGNDLYLAWPNAEIAVMGTNGAVQILGSKGLTAQEYETRFLNPWEAAGRGLVDDVIDPRDTRARICDGLATLSMKRATTINRRHSNTPL